MTLFALSAVFAVTLTPRTTEVVIAKDACPTVRFAAAELTNYLGRIFGAAVPLVNAPTDGKASVILGENEWSRAAGLAPEQEPRDTFFVKAGDGKVLICGKDDPSFNLSAYVEKGGSYAQLLWHERATVHGVYAFLEKYAGVRFYLPDEELGTIVPRTDKIAVPDGLAKTTPDFLIREPYFGGDGLWYCAKDPAVDNGRLKAKLWLRHRFGTKTIPCCHGIRKFKLRERFGKTHPEFFPIPGKNEHLCWTNPELREIIYRDVKERLAKEPIVDIMPDDGFRPCPCARCQAAYDKSRGPDGYASDLMWSLTAEIGRRLIAEGVKGDITMMAYSPYCCPPTFDLPPNVQVMVAEYGPWSCVRPDDVAKQKAEIRAWTAKLGHRVWIWTYPNKHGRLNLADIPSMAPHAWGRYYREVASDIFGTFAECESDRAIYNYLNYAVFARVAWDAKTDVAAVVAEHDRLMFGAAASEMHAFNALLEKAWTERVAGNSIVTELGPEGSPPCALELWTSVYDSAFLHRLKAHLDAAKGMVPSDSLEAKRIALMKREFFLPLARAAKAFFAKIDPKIEQAWRDTNATVTNLLEGAKVAAEVPFDESPVLVSTGRVEGVGISLAAGSGRLLKPNTRYRLSAFLKLEDVKQLAPGGGVDFRIWDSKNNWFPRSSDGGSLYGTTGWIAQHFEIVTDAATNKKTGSYYALDMRNCTGAIRYNHVRLDELGPAD